MIEQQRRAYAVEGIDDNDEAQANKKRKGSAEDEVGDVWLRVKCKH